MCGVAGIVDLRPTPDVDEATVRQMCGLLAHRGPDHEGVVVSGCAGLGHRRLAITDLVTGQQPLANEDRSVWVVFNGEIYNWRRLRSWLEKRGHHFVTSTDTEVIPHLYEEFGDEFVNHMEGVWAIGLWDERRRRFLLSRDRVGEKHLVYRAVGGIIHFASEAKALFADPKLTRAVDPQGLLDVLTFGFVTEERTMFEGVSSVLPATVLVFEDGRPPTSRRYWDAADVPAFDGGFTDAVDELEHILSQVARERLMGDVPYGLLLSGGVDSPLVGSFLVEHDPNLASYTIRRGDANDETASAATIAAHLGSEHHVVDLNHADVTKVAARIPWLFDQPFFNDAAIANHLLAETVRDELTVVITGDGGDHAFSGISRHEADAIASRLVSVPDLLLATGEAVATACARASGMNDGLRRLALVMRGARIRDSRRRWLALHELHLPMQHPELVAAAPPHVNGYDPEAAPLAYYDQMSSAEHLDRMLYAELRFQLPANDLLKVDRTFMANQVAGRAPLLDRRVLEFATSLPSSFKRRGRTCKLPLRELARRRLPAQVSRSAKIGLAVPLRRWLRGPLGESVGRLFASKRFADRGVFDQRGALHALDRHRRSRADYGYALWTMAITELWFRCQIDDSTESRRTHLGGRMNLDASWPYDRHESIRARRRAVTRYPLSDLESLIRRVYRYVAYRVGDGPDAEDITSDVFERAVKYRATYDEKKGDPAAWLIGIARSRIASMYRACRSPHFQSISMSCPTRRASNTAPCNASLSLRLSRPWLPAIVS